MQRRTLSAVLAALTISSLLVGSAARADDPPQPPPAGVPGGFPSWEALFAEQDERNGQVEAVRAAATQAGDTGFSQAIADPTAATVVLRWKGTPRPAVQTVINAQSAVNPITVLPAAYNEAELHAEAARIGTESAGASSFASVAPKPDGSGLEITWNAGATNQLLAAQTASQASVAVSFAGESTDPPQPLLSRQNDASPWRGGARTSNCTTGFAVTVSGAARLLYAAHCGSAATYVYDGAGHQIGTVSSRNHVTDSSSILVNGTSEGWVWDGGPQSTYKKKVAGSAPVVIGNMICTSGALSGAVCGGKITHLGVTHAEKIGVARFVNVNNAPMVGHGDSGGPAYATRSDGRVTAQGIISSGYEKVSSCAGEGGRTCYKGGHIVPVRDMLSRFNATLRTAS